MSMFKRSYLDPDSIFGFNDENLDAASTYKRFWAPAKRQWWNLEWSLNLIAYLFSVWNKLYEKRAFLFFQ